MSQRPIVGIVTCGTSAQRPLTVARTQAFAACAAPTGWELIGADPLSDHRTDLDGAHAVILIEPTPEDVATHLARGRAVVLDGLNSVTPSQAQHIIDLATTHRQPVMIGDELLYSDALSSALSSATQIGPLTRIETRILHPTGRPSPTTAADWNERGLPAILRLLLALRRLRGESASPTWERAQTSRQSGHLQITLSGRLPGTPNIAVTVIVGEHSGRSVINDVQLVSATGVVRGELMPDVHLEVNGEPRALAAPTHSPAQLEVFGMIPMLDLLRRAVHHRTQPLTGPTLLKEALDVSGWAWEEAVGPSQ